MSFYLRGHPISVCVLTQPLQTAPFMSSVHLSRKTPPINAVLNCTLSQLCLSPINYFISVLRPAIVVEGQFEGHGVFCLRGGGGGGGRRREKVGWEVKGIG